MQKPKLTYDEDLLVLWLVWKLDTKGIITLCGIFTTEEKATRYWEGTKLHADTLRCHKERTCADHLYAGLFNFTRDDLRK